MAFDKFGSLLSVLWSDFGEQTYTKNWGHHARTMQCTKTVADSHPGGGGLPIQRHCQKAEGGQEHCRQSHESLQKDRSSGAREVNWSPPKDHRKRGPPAVYNGHEEPPEVCPVAER